MALLRDFKVQVRDPTRDVTPKTGSNRKPLLSLPESNGRKGCCQGPRRAAAVRAWRVLWVGRKRWALNCQSRLSMPVSPISQTNCTSASNGAPLAVGQEGQRWFQGVEQRGPYILRTVTFMKWKVIINVKCLFLFWWWVAYKVVSV